MVGLGIYLEVDDGSSELSWLPLVLILGYIVSSGHSSSRYYSDARRRTDFPVVWV